MLSAARMPLLLCINMLLQLLLPLLLLVPQAREGDTRSLLEMYGELAYVDLEKESVYEMTEANMLKVRCRQHAA